MKIESYVNGRGTTCWGLYGSDSKKYKNTPEFEDFNLSWYSGTLGNGKGWGIPLSKLEAVKAWLVKINGVAPANDEVAKLQKEIKELKDEQKIFKKKIKVLKDFAASKKKSLVVDDEGDFSMETDESSDEE